MRNAPRNEPRCPLPRKPVHHLQLVMRKDARSDRASPKFLSGLQIVTSGAGLSVHDHFAACLHVRQPEESPSRLAHRDRSSRSQSQISCPVHTEQMVLHDPRVQGSCLRRALENCLRQSCFEYPSGRSRLSSRRASRPWCSSTARVNRSAHKHVLHPCTEKPMRIRSSHAFPDAALR